MRGIVLLCDGSRKELPVLTGWQMTHTDGTSSDSFSVSFVWEKEWEEILRKAVRFEAWQGDVQRFYGIVDEYEVCRDENGTVGTVYGRGLAGLLMDNQVWEQEYYWVRLSDVLKHYAEPYRIPAVVYDENYLLTSYAVDYGTDCWSALSGFCLWAAGVQPRFLQDGTLVISGKQGETRDMNGVQSEKWIWRQTRYGVYSRVIAKYVGTSTQQQVDNAAFQALGGCATHRMTIPRKNRCRAGLSSPNQVLKDSQKTFRVLELTVPELFWAQPMDVVQGTENVLGISGSFRVLESENRVDARGSSCRLRMQKIN